MDNIPFIFSIFYAIVYLADDVQNIGSCVIFFGTSDLEDHGIKSCSTLGDEKLSMKK